MLRELKWILSDGIAKICCQMAATNIEQYLEETLPQNDYNREEKTMLKWRSLSNATVESNDSLSGGFDCNICLDSVQDPVVTLCGHLYCWPCIYKWLHFYSISYETRKQQPNQQCPVCKARISQATLVPLFGRGQSETTKSSNCKNPNLGIVIPQRPLACGLESPSSPPTANFTHQPRSQLYYSQPATYHASPNYSSGWTMRNTFDMVVLMVGELILASVCGNSRSNMFTYPNSYNLAGTTSPRVRRHVMQADRSLSRICFFLYCCAFLCLLLF